MTEGTDERDALSRLFTGGSVVLFGLLLELGISFVGKLLIAPYLGRVDYGAVSLGITTATILSTLALVGLDTGIGRYLPRQSAPEDRRGVLVSGFTVGVALSVAAAAGLYYVAPAAARAFAHGEVAPAALETVFRVFALAVPFGAVMKLSLGSIQGVQESFPKVAIQNVTFPMVRFGGVVVALIVGTRVFGISAAYVASYVAAAAVGLFYVWRRTDVFDRTIDARTQYRSLLTFSLPLVVTAVMSYVLSDIDIYMLGFIDGPAVVGDYNTIYPLAQLLIVAVSGFGFLFMPLVSELDAAGRLGRARRLYQVVTKWIVVVTLPPFLVLFAFPQRSIELTFGAEYAGAAPALSVLTVGFFLHAVFGLNKGALTSVGRTRLIMYDDIVGAVVNVALNLVLIPRYGLVGAAWATTVSYGVLNGLYSVQLYRETEIQPFTVAMARPLVIGGATMGGIYLLARELPVLTPPVLVGLASVFGVAYAFAVLRFGVEPEEVKLVMDLETEYGIDLGPLKRVARWFM